MMYTVIIPAAGQGRRMGCGHNKVFLEVDGIPVIRRTVEVFQAHAACSAIYLAAKEDEIGQLTTLLHDFPKVRGIIAGGSERQYSIYNVLKVIPKTDIVMVHDGARPFISHETLDALYESALNNRAAIAAVPAKDTVKVVVDGQVSSTPERSTLWLTQTPQAFTYDVLLTAYQRAEADGFLGTDDASLVERTGVIVHVAQGSYDNIKLTTPEDLYFAAALLKKRGI
ncbi:2-C-methyl-D-erythritol 4-phosphate cytidylyltransferase [Macrococcus equipercicus]|uniref:2-C-methyl-D-erythritol 4-phosphate cytidylyltransferase n=1 Tax=Macrococcus equipercicus TaxID=69967 RepID=A0A9Q9BPL8_9STAP|nr:2-C-methyl-D-erythritol 4-phosphate cytidylyltransferase [Macrococcus equipercicus]UTH14930.1 2-C-methyl-D-erythritol 4-phosphate cytidylyltransferase [Macrococcus equipercicus]